MTTYIICNYLGPPGTGKTHVGVEIMRVLLAPENRQATKIGPILTICYTNHALDNFLQGFYLIYFHDYVTYFIFSKFFYYADLLKVGINKIVRMGSRSKSEIISQFNLEEICRNRPHQSRSIGHAYHDLDEIIDEAIAINKQLKSKSIFFYRRDVISYFRLNYPSHYEKLRDPDIPPYLLDNDDDEWQRAGGRKRSMIEKWVNGDDLKEARRFKELFTNLPKKSKKNKKNVNSYLLLGNEDSPANDPNDSVSDEEQDTIDIDFRNWILAWKKPTTRRNLEELKVFY